MNERVLVYDFNASGHCPGWMFLVASGFRREGAEVLVGCQAHLPEVKPWAERLRELGCRISTIPPGATADAFPLHAGEVARRAGLQRVFFPNFDSIVYDLGKCGARGVFEGLDVGGIWLRPELKQESCGVVERLWRKVLRTRAAKMRRRHARAVSNNRAGLAEFLPEQRRVGRVRLFFTSSEAAQEVGGRLAPGETAVICDPWLSRSGASKREAREALGLPGERVIFLHLGTSRREKGLADACEAMGRLDGALGTQGLLLRAGRVDKGDRPALRKLEDRGGAVVLDRYLSDAELDLCYAASDWVLLPYRGQKESSGVLIHAAANRRPVIASDFGLIGEATRSFALGRVFEHQNVGALAEALAGVLQEDGEAVGYAPGLVRFAAANSPEKFQKTLVDGWLRL